MSDMQLRLRIAAETAEARQALAVRALAGDGGETAVPLVRAAAGAAEVGDVRVGEQNGRQIVELVLARVDQHLAQGLQRGTGPLSAAMAGVFGLRRVGR